MKAWIRNISIVVIGIGLNVIGRLIAQILNLPVWLDMTGTCIASYFGGLWTGVLVGLFNNIISAFYDRTALVYALTSVTAAVMMHIFIKKGYMNHALKAVVSSFWLGVLCTVISTPLNLIFYAGYSGNVWGDTLVDMLRWHDISNISSALAGEVIIEIVDKQVCVMFAYIIIYLFHQLQKNNVARMKSMALILVVGMAVSRIVYPLQVQAEEAGLFEDNFIEKVYNNTSGMVSSEANTICETNDGYIWIGSYAGLTKFDGNEFEFVREGGLVNVVGMMTDSKGRLWIGTNDAGIARYENGTYIYFTTDDGLPSNSIRCFAEDKDGNIYAGTSDKICKFSTDDTIEILDENITFVKAMAVYHDMLIVLDNNGDIYALDDDKTFSITNQDSEDFFYYCLAVTSKGLMVGTESGELFVIDIADSGMIVKEQIDLSANEISAVFEDSKGRIWIGTESGFGYIDQNGNYEKLSYNGFDASIVCFLEDYQGNIWIASSHYGVMKLSESSFVDMFEKAGIDNAVVNAVTYYEGAYFCGTDNGLIILDDRDFSVITNELTEITNGCRVRSVFKDSQNKLWLCTYNGLFCYDSQGGIRCYNQENDKTTSDRFRCMTELKDGTFAIGTADGINFIRDGRVAGTLTAEDGLANTQILSIVEGQDKTVWAGSDGSGIYVISEGKLIENYTVEDGLSSNVILRIVPCEDGCLIVTSNALCHMDGDGKITKLDKFPYFNNYDIMIDNETAYITCSAGLYEVDLEQLCSNSGKQFRLYSAGEGLISGLTANSWNYLSEDGRLYLCSNNGVTVFNGSNDNGKASMKYGMVSVECDGKELKLPDSSNYTVPSNAKNVSIYASVRNHAFTDVKVRFYVKELDNNPKLYNWNEIEPIRILKPDLSEYHICLQILDSSGEKVLQESVYTVNRELRMWEQPSYKIYLVVVCFEIFFVTIFTVVSMILFVLRKNELERLQVNLENKVNEQTGELRLQQQRIKKLFIQTVTALSEAVDAKDRYTSGHSKRVAGYARMIAERMGKSKEEQEEIYRAGLLHDVGKIRIPNSIINKAGKLTDEEFNVIKIHPVTGYHILRGISGSQMIAIATKYHHERYDGTGYPNGLAEEKIPEAARILAVADSYDAMTSNRSYRKALPQAVVRSEIEKGKGTQFDPYIADIMLQMIDEDKEYAMKQDDALQRNILVVDDEPMNNKIITHIMRDEPMYKIVPAYRGKEALEILEQQQIDLILLDVNMPEMDGLETLRLIRKKYQTPVALMTGDRNLNTSSEFAEMGCDDYITKPFLPLLIKEVIHNMTERTNIED